MANTMNCIHHQWAFKTYKTEKNLQCEMSGEEFSEEEVGRDRDTGAAGVAESPAGRGHVSVFILT